MEFVELYVSVTTLCMLVSVVFLAVAGLKGKGLKLIHHYPDQLWGLGPKSVPDASFTTTRIYPQVRLETPARDEGAAWDNCRVGMLVRGSRYQME